MLLLLLLDGRGQPRRRDDVLRRPLRVNDEVLTPRRTRGPEERTVERVVVRHRLSTDVRPAASLAARHVTARDVILGRRHR